MAERSTPRRRATSADVARESGVSRATVSYVLNDVAGTRISAATRAVVLETARRLGHVPHAPARSLRLGRSNIVLALVRDFAIGYISNRVLRRLDLALAERGYLVLAHRYDASLRSVSDLWGTVSPALVVAMGGLSVPEQEAIDGSEAKLLRAHGFVPHEAAGRMQAHHLHGRGHRRLGYAFPKDPTLSLIAGERLAGVQAACQELAIDPPVVCEVDSADPRSAAAALDRWSSGPEAVTGVCAHNDELALLLSHTLTHRGLRPGADLALIGVDNIPLARVSLTTIEIDVEAWAEAVAVAALAMLDGEDAPEPSHDFLRLIVRGSA